MRFKLAFAGFGVVARGFSELLLEKREMLESRYGMTWTVVAISDNLKGSIMDPKGLDLAAVVKAAEKGKGLEELKAPAKGFDVLQMIERSGANTLVEVTYTNVKTGEPATTHVRKAIEKGMNVVTT